MKKQNFYFRIWANTIKYFLQNNQKLKSRNWKLYLLLLTSAIYSSGIAAFELLLRIIFRNNEIMLFLDIDISIFPLQSLNTAVATFIVIGLPIILINYFLIFYKDHYKKLIEDCENMDRKHILLFYLYVIWSFFIVAIIHGILMKNGWYS